MKTILILLALSASAAAQDYGLGVVQTMDAEPDKPKEDGGANCFGL